MERNAIIYVLRQPKVIYNQGAAHGRISNVIKIKVDKNFNYTQKFITQKMYLCTVHKITSSRT